MSERGEGHSNFHPRALSEEHSDETNRARHAPRSLSEERSDETKRERRALWIVPVSDLGGVARHVIDASRVGIPGWELTILCPEGPLAERLRAQGARVIAGAFGPHVGVRASRRALSVAMREVRPEIVHSHLAYADIVSALTRMPNTTRRFTTEHGIAGDDGVYHRSSLQARVMAAVHRWRFRRFHGVIAVSRATRDAMKSKWGVQQPITVIPNGVDLPDGVKRRDASSVTGLRILSLSRLAPEKRIDKLLEAFALIISEHPEATLTIAGDGPLGDELKDFADQLGILEAATFPGFVEPDSALANADVVAQLSIWENCSYTLLDAVARGLRVIAADTGGNREIVGESAVVNAIDRDSIAAATPRAKIPGGRRSHTVLDMCQATSLAYGAPADEEVSHVD